MSLKQRGVYHCPKDVCKCSESSYVPRCILERRIRAGWAVSSANSSGPFALAERSLRGHGDVGIEEMWFLTSGVLALWRRQTSLRKLAVEGGS